MVQTRAGRRNPRLNPVTYYGNAIPFGAAIADVADLAGVSVVVPSDVSVAVNVDLRGIDGFRALQLVAEQAGMVCEWRDGAVRVRKSGGAAEAVGLILPGYEKTDEVREAARRLMGDDAVVEILGDRLLVGGSAASVDRMEEVSQLMAQGPSSWMVELRLVQVSEGFAHALGLDWNVGGELVARLGVGEGIDSTARMAVVVAAIAEASRRSEGAELLTVARLHLVEGREVRYVQGDRVPIRKRSVSPEGTVTDVDVEYVETGFTLDVSGRRVPEGLMLELRPELSSVAAIIDGAPQVRTQTLQSVAVVRSGEWLVLTGFEGAQVTRDSNDLPLGRKAAQGASTRVVILVRAERISNAQ